MICTVHGDIPVRENAIVVSIKHLSFDIEMAIKDYTTKDKVPIYQHGDYLFVYLEGDIRLDIIMEE